MRKGIKIEVDGHESKYGHRVHPCGFICRDGRAYAIGLASNEQTDAAREYLAGRSPRLPVHEICNIDTEYNQVDDGVVLCGYFPGSRMEVGYSPIGPAATFTGVIEPS